MVAGKLDTYRINLEEQQEENKKMKNQQNSIYGVAAAKAAFNRKRVQVEIKILCEEIFSS